jgi:hypothetical protein
VVGHVFGLFQPGLSLLLPDAIGRRSGDEVVVIAQHHQIPGAAQVARNLGLDGGVFERHSTSVPHVQRQNAALGTHQRILDVQAREPRKVAVICDKSGTMLDGQGGEVGVRDERPTGLTRRQQTGEKSPVPIRRQHDRGDGLLKPRLHNLACVVHS